MEGDKSHMAEDEEENRLQVNAVQSSGRRGMGGFESRVLSAQGALACFGTLKDTLPDDLKWRQVEGAFYSASILELDLHPAPDHLKELVPADDVHDHHVTIAHGTGWKCEFRRN